MEGAAQGSKEGVAERSKALRLGRNHESGMGSNPIILIDQLRPPQKHFYFFAYIKNLRPQYRIDSVQSLRAQKRIP